MSEPQIQESGSTGTNRVDPEERAYQHGYDTAWDDLMDALGDAPSELGCEPALRFLRHLYEEDRR